MTTQFHAVMLDETGCEFGASVTAGSREAAYEYLSENYPESRCIQLESPADTAAREKRIYDAALMDEGDWDFNYDEEEDFDYEEDDDFDDFTDEERSEIYQRRAEAAELY
jgi:hypothetical protein